MDAGADSWTIGQLGTVMDETAGADSWTSGQLGTDMDWTNTLEQLKTYVAENVDPTKQK